MPETAQAIPVPDSTSIPGITLEVPGFDEIFRSESEAAKAFGSRVEEMAKGMRDAGARQAWFSACAEKAQNAIFYQSTPWRHWALTRSGLVFLTHLIAKTADGKLIPPQEVPVLIDQYPTTYDKDTGKVEKYGAADSVMVMWRLVEPLKNSPSGPIGS